MKTFVRVLKAIGRTIWEGVLYLLLCAAILVVATIVLCIIGTAVTLIGGLIPAGVIDWFGNYAVYLVAGVMGLCIAAMIVMVIKDNYDRIVAAENTKSKEGEE